VVKNLNCEERKMSGSETSEALVVSSSLCPRCGNEFKKRLLVFNSKKECFICNRVVCSECISREERYEPLTNKKGYACLDCYPRTKVSSSSSLLPGVMDINGAVDAIESRIPGQLASISAKMDAVNQVSEKLDEIVLVKGAIEEITKLIALEVEDVKKFSETFTIRNWGIIKKDIYKIILAAGIGIFVLSGLITVQVMLIIKYLYPLF
jgi:hypothetical protein